MSFLSSTSGTFLGLGLLGLASIFSAIVGGRRRPLMFVALALGHVMVATASVTAWLSYARGTGSSWLSPWLVADDVQSLLRLGIEHAPVGLMVGFIVTSFFGISVTLLSAGMPARKIAALSLSGVATALAWSASEALVSVLAFFLAGVAQLLFFSDERLPHRLVRLAKTRWSALVLFAAGVSLLSADQNAAWIGDFGTWLVMMGAWIAFGLFPFSEWSNREDERVIGAERGLVALIGEWVPGWVALSIVFHLDFPTLHFFGVAACVATVVTAVMALSQQGLTRGFSGFSASALGYLWIIQCFGLSSALIPALLGSLFSAFGLTWLIALLRDTRESSTSVTPLSHRLFGLLVLILFSGFFGCLASIGQVEALGTLLERPVAILLFLMATFFTHAALWRWMVFEGALSLRTTRERGLLASSIVSAALGLSWFWTRQPFGIPNLDGAVGRTGLLARLRPQLSDEILPIDAAILGWSVAITVGMMLGFWMGARNQRGARALRDSLPRFFGWAQASFGVGRVFVAAGTKTQRFSKALRETLEESFWSRRVPAAGTRVGTLISTGVNRLDARVWSAWTLAARSVLEPLAKATELLQNGDPRWAIAFGLGCGMAILVHFLRT